MSELPRELVKDVIDALQKLNDGVFYSVKLIKTKKKGIIILPTTITHFRAPKKKHKPETPTDNDDKFGDR